MTYRPHGRPAGSLLARVHSRLTDRWQTVAQIARHDMVGDASRVLSTLEREGHAERDGQRWRRAGAPHTNEAEPEAPPLHMMAPPPDPPASVLTTEQLAAVVLEQAARRPAWATQAELATSVEIRTGASRAAIEVEIRRQLEDGGLVVCGPQGTGVRTAGNGAAHDAETEPVTTGEAEHEDPGETAGVATDGPLPVPSAPDRASLLLAALRATPGLTLHELGAAIGVTSSRAGQIARDIGCRSVAEGPGRTARRRWFAPDGWLDLPGPPTPVSYGERCRRIRELRGWSQFDLAKALAPLLGASHPKSVQSSISAIERGRDPGERWRAALDQVLADPPSVLSEDAPTEHAQTEASEPRTVVGDELAMVVAALDRMGVPAAPEGWGLAWRMGFVEGRWTGK